MELSIGLADQVMESCTACGNSLAAIQGEPSQTHQVTDIAVPKKVKPSAVGVGIVTRLPSGAKGQVNYGSGARALVANLSVRQYMPYKRTVEFIEDIFGVPISQATVTNLLKHFQDSTTHAYQHIQTQVLNAPVVGSDETGAKVNGAKGWFHTYQSPQHTLIGYHPSRGATAQKQFYPQGLPNSIVVSDCFAMQLSTPAAANQLCHTHLLRKLNAMEEATLNRNGQEK